MVRVECGRGGEVEGMVSRRGRGYQHEDTSRCVSRTSERSVGWAVGSVGLEPGVGAALALAAVLVAPRVHRLLEGRLGPPTEEAQCGARVGPGSTAAVQHSFAGCSGPAVYRNESRHFRALSCAGSSTRPHITEGQQGQAMALLCLTRARAWERLWFSVRTCAKGVSHTVSLASQRFHALALPI